MQAESTREEKEGQRTLRLRRRVWQADAVAGVIGPGAGYKEIRHHRCRLQRSRRDPATQIDTVNLAREADRKKFVAETGYTMLVSRVKEEQV